MITANALGIAILAYGSGMLRAPFSENSAWTVEFANPLVDDRSAQLSLDNGFGGWLWWATLVVYVLAWVILRRSRAKWLAFDSDRDESIEKERRPHSLAEYLSSAAARRSGKPELADQLRQIQDRREKLASRQYNGLHRRSQVGITLVILASLAVMFFALPEIAKLVISVPLTASPQWLLENAGIVALAILIAAGIAGALFLLGSMRALRSFRTLAGTVTGLLIQAIPLALLGLVYCWSLSFGLAVLDGVAAQFNFVQESIYASPLESMLIPLSSTAVVLIYFGMIFLPYAVAQVLAGLPSAHDLYRRLVSRCFAVSRSSATEVVLADPKQDIAMSSLRNSQSPELLICAAANVTDAGSALAGINALPLVFSSSSVRIPSVSSAQIPMRALEHPGVRDKRGRIQSHANEWPLGLTSAVAVTGAAISPTLGRHTKTQLRPVLAALGVRLGRWLPNPASPRARMSAMSDRLTMPRSNPTYVLKELWGTHSSRDQVIYASDGGHFENMGIVELLRRRCGTIWVVDASPQTQGHPLSLTQSILLAEAETGCSVELDLANVVRENGESQFRSVWCEGTVRYADGSSGVIRVVKLGISGDHSSAVKNYALIDRGFPFHPTLNQVYSADRFGAYRRLGWESMTQLLDQCGQGAAS